MGIFSKKKTETPRGDNIPAGTSIAPAMPIAPVISTAPTSAVSVISAAPSSSTPVISPAPAGAAPTAQLAEIALSTIHDGVLMTDANNIIRFINPAAVTMTDCGMAENALGLDYVLIIKIENKDGRTLTEAENQLYRSMQLSHLLESYRCLLISGNSGKRIPISLTMIPVNGYKVITFRDITKELAEESEQAEFISTASHEMRTPVATIDGYISLCLNPSTATIDERAKGYLDAASKASKHLGKLFQDLLDATKLDDGRLRPELAPVDAIATIQELVKDHATAAAKKQINYLFGSSEPATPGDLRLEQVVYTSVDINFLREIMDNIIDNAIKYTPAGGTVSINVKGDGDRVLISVSDTGIGISATDLQHVFQKFYRADNSDTREIGGTGLGLYLVKQRTEAMGGRVWAESVYGQGTVFYVSLPRISAEEYNKRMIAVENNKMVNGSAVPSQATADIPSQPMTNLPGSPPPLPEQPNLDIINNKGGTNE